MKRVLLLGLTLLTAPAFAAEGEVDYRQNVYKAIGGHMSAMADIVQQKVSHGSHMALHADAMADLAVMAKTLFPAGSEGGDALPGVWANPDDFAARLGRFEEAAAALKTATASGEGVLPAFQAVAQSCKGCHDEYRKK
ncbi:MAG TPA: cytochrome C [Gammaproteobacteria bacterium]|jgi:cytochrome c556|nr:cytochrome C [Gammaproteobacteria bacterium]